MWDGEAWDAKGPGACRADFSNRGVGQGPRRTHPNPLWSRVIPHRGVGSTTSRRPTSIRRTIPPVNPNPAHPRISTSRLLTYTHPVTDEVDQLVQAWRRERPDLDVSPLEILSRVTRLARHLDIARKAAFSDVGLEIWEFDVLAALRRAGDPYALSPGQLGSQTMVTSGTITNRVDRLEERGLVRRERDPNDRRGVRVVLTDKGRTVVDEALTDLLNRERQLLEDLSATEQKSLANMLKALVGPFDD